MKRHQTLAVRNLCPFCSRVAAPLWTESRVWTCPACRLTFRNPPPAPEELTELYETIWEAPEGHGQETGGTDVGFARVYAKNLARSLNCDSFRGLRILDFGAGRGAMLTVLAELGAEVSAIEPFGYEYVKAQGFTVYRSVDELPPDAEFDGVVAIDIIEHLSEPWREFSRLRTLIGEGGWLYAATPNFRGLKATLRGPRWREVVQPQHVMFFTPDSLESVLSDSGFSRYQRLKWFVNYRYGNLRTCLNFGLQSLWLDGQLRYLAWK